MTSRVSFAGVVAFASFLALFPLASPAKSQGPLEQKFDQLDADGNGKLTLQELPRPAIFKLLDLDGDGEITKAEAGRAIAGGAGKAIAAAETAAQTSGEPAPTETPVRQGPQPVRPGDHGIGCLIPEASFTALDGASHNLSELCSNRLVVLAMTSTSCPLSKKYLPTLVELAKASGGEVAWVLVNPVAADKVENMQAAAEQFGERALYIHDRDGELAQTLGALTTTDVIVLDAARTVVYHGAIDDQYGFGYSLEAPRHRYLADALQTLEAGKTPLVSATEAPGCTLEQPSSAPAKQDVTYHNRISRIVQQHCLECHRDGGVAPFSLASYDDVSAHAGMIKQVVERGVMPPWFAAEASAPDQAASGRTPWANDRSLGASEKHDLLAWLAGGKPEGDPHEAPQDRKFDEEWQIGKPDAIFEFAEPVTVKATGVMPYQYVAIETNLAEDKWVQAIEIQPGDRGVVHHVLVFVQGEDGEDGRRDDRNGRDGFWGIYVPGNSALIYPDGFAKQLPKGARLVFQMHYTPNGTATTDRTRIGLIYARQPPEHEVRVAGISNTRIDIPPGADNHREEAVLAVPFDAEVLGFLPHMHLRGKACKYELARIDGGTTTLLDIPRYDFNWQLFYRYYEPLSVRIGDTLRFTGWFDNSDKNPANPDPGKEVHWGEQTFDEMLLGYVEYYVPGAGPGESPAIRGRRDRGRRPAFDLEAVFKRLDRDGDGKLTGDEIPAAQRDNLLRLDSDKDGAITLEEAKRLLGLRNAGG